MENTGIGLFLAPGGTSVGVPFPCRI